MGIQRKPQVLFLIVFCLILAACSGEAPPGVVSAWIDVPLDGLTLPLDQAVNIEGHADAPSGIARVEIWVNGELAARIDSPQTAADLARFQTDCMPPGAGEYRIQAIAVAGDGVTSQPFTRRISISADLPQVSPSPTPVESTPTVTGTTTTTVTPTVTPSPTLPPDVEIDFWAEPPQIQAGACSNLRWHVENALAVRLGSTDVSLDGSYQACLCEDEVYTLTVTRMDKSELQRVLTVEVSGSCDTPTPTATEDISPPADNTPPPAPSPYLPPNGGSVGCSTLAAVAWNQVTDPSGIAEYQVQVELVLGGGKTQPHPDSPWTGLTATGLKVPVQCGGVYRWRVRAVDGAGNAGQWSNWFEFGVDLG
jgi:hypothetical protein